MSRGKPGLPSVAMVVHQPRLSGHPDFHACHELVYVTAGPYRVATDRQEWQGRPGDAFVYPAGTRHRIEPAQDLRTHVYVLQWSRTLRCWPRPFRVHDTHGRLLVALNWMRDAGTPETSEEVRLLRALHFVALQEVERLRAGADWKGDSVQTAARALCGALEHPFSLRELAEQVGLSPWVLAHQFKKAMGLAPIQYQRRARLEKALALITSTRLPLKDIAPQVGFASEFHLSYLIKRAFGRPPSEFRRRGKTASRPSPGG